MCKPRVLDLANIVLPLLQLHLGKRLVTWAGSDLAALSGTQVTGVTRFRDEGGSSCTPTVSVGERLDLAVGGTYGLAMEKRA